MNEQGYSYDYIHGTTIYIYQKKDMFRINTDTSLLAHFMRVEEGETVLDIGTNNGALLAVAGQYHPNKLIGIEIQEEAAQLAKYNMQHLGLRQAEIRCGDVSTMTMPKVDVVVCNPPYFKTDETSNRNESKQLAIARHEVYLDLETLAKKVSEALDEKGRFYVVHRANRIVEIASVLRANRLAIRSLQFVYDEAKKEAISVLIEAIKDGKENTHVLLPQWIQR